MSDFWPVLISVVVVMTIVLFLSGKFNLSAKYERKPRVLNSWSALDQGIDPTEEKDK